MKIHVLEATPQRLALALRPASQWAYPVFGVLFIAMGLGTGWLLGRRTIFSCDDSPGGVSCIAMTGVLRPTRVEAPLDQVAVRVTESSTAGVAARTLVVTMAGREVPLPFVGMDGDAKNAAAARIESLRTRETAPPLRIAEDYRLIGWLLGLLVAAGGVVMILAMEVIKLVLDRKTARVTIDSRGRFSARHVELELGEIEDLRTEEFTVNNSTSWNVIFALRDGSDIAVARSALFTTASANELIRRLREFRSGS